MNSLRRIHRLEVALVLPLLACVVIVALLSHGGSVNQQGALVAYGAAPPARFQPASWAECHGARNVLEGPYRVGARWMVDVRRGFGRSSVDMTLECARPRSFNQRHFYKGVFV